MCVKVRLRCTHRVKWLLRAEDEWKREFELLPLREIHLCGMWGSGKRKSGALTPAEKLFLGHGCCGTRGWRCSHCAKSVFRAWGQWKRGLQVVSLPKIRYEDIGELQWGVGDVVMACNAFWGPWSCDKGGSWGVDIC